MGKVGGGAVEGVEGMERTGLMRERWEEKRPGCGCELDGGGGGGAREWQAVRVARRWWGLTLHGSFLLYFQ